MKKAFDCKVLKNTFISEGVFSLLVERPADMPPVKPGHFFNLKCTSGDYPLLRRPISISFSNEKVLEFTIIAKGQGTELLSRLQEEDNLNVLGPLGNGYDLELPIKKVLVVGGGIGVAPQMELTRVLEENGVQTKVLVGYRNEPYGLETYFNYTDDVEIASEYSLIGLKGYVTTLLERALETEKFDMVFACGPQVMMKKVRDICHAHKTQVQLLMEERMACGVGACLVCTCGVMKDGVRENVRTCKEGPVFWGDEVIFDE